MTEEDLKQLNYSTLKTSIYFYEKIKNKMDEISLIELCSLLNIFGRGFSIKKLESIQILYPSLFDFTISINTKLIELEKIKSLKVLSRHICESLLKYEIFLKKINKI